MKFNDRRAKGLIVSTNPGRGGRGVFGPLRNPSFENGTTSWTASVGSFFSITNYGTDVVPYAGSFMASCINGGSNVTFYQDLSIPGGYHPSIANGDVYLANVTARHNPGVPAVSGANDQARLFVSFLAANGSVISSVYTGWNTLNSTWTLMSIPTTQIPANTKTIRIGTENAAEDATHDNFWDAFSQPALQVSFLAGTLTLEDGATLVTLEDGTTHVETWSV